MLMSGEGARIGIAHRRDDLPVALEKVEGDLAAEASRAAGDEDALDKVVSLLLYGGALEI
jgi:hypothetical protein